MTLPRALLKQIAFRHNAMSCNRVGSLERSYEEARCHKVGPTLVCLIRRDREIHQLGNYWIH